MKTCFTERLRGVRVWKSWEVLISAEVAMNERSKPDFHGSDFWYTALPFAKFAEFDAAAL